MINKYDYLEYPKLLPKDDYWGQVKRTINGKPVSEEQIKMIIDAIVDGLSLNTNDYCLDLACGNGALSKSLFPYLYFLQGVDFSEYLIEIANSNFKIDSKSNFICSDALEFVSNEKNPQKYNKVICYGSFSYFSKENAFETLKVIYDRFKNVEKMFIGNLPDKSKVNLLSSTSNKNFLPEIDQHASQIGIWRTKEEFQFLASQTGWNCVIKKMPETFYSAYYRYDAVLLRN
jgi:cyclopropane fatty-acyl-phospholipid synthase-like methyltransferase